jgi:hypothetical protein
MTGPSAAWSGDPVWRQDLDALAFVPEGHGGLCFIHRLAFRTLVGHDPDPAACEAWFRWERAAFAAAASRKIEGRRLPRGANFHLTSRDIARENRRNPA